MKKTAFLFILLVLVVSCGLPKKDNNNLESIENTENNEVQSETPKEDLIVVLKRPHKLTETKDFLKNSGLVWDKLVFDQEALQVGLIKVPAEKRDFWLNRLIESGQFDEVKIYSSKTLTEVIEKEKNSLLNVRKTPCFGDCPTYEINIDKEGNAIFTGNKYVVAEGKHIFKLSEEQLSKVNKLLNKKDFSSFNDKYDNPKITDLPSTFISHKGKDVQIRVWKGAPTELIELHEYLERILVEKKFIK